MSTPLKRGAGIIELVAYPNTFSLREIQVVIVAGFHLFPFRTEKLSPPAPMVLHTRGRVGSRRLYERKPFRRNPGGLFLFVGREH